MNTELCRIKGTREGLVITISEADQFSEVLSSLDRQLQASQSFFQGKFSQNLSGEGDSYRQSDG